MASKRAVATGPAELTFDDLRQIIDWTLVGNAIEGPADGAADDKLTLSFDVEDAKELVWNGAERWLARDLVEFQLQGEEVHFELTSEKAVAPDNPTGLITHGYQDILGTVLGRNKPYNAYAGKTFAIDWKTSKNTLGTEWKHRLLNSHQWPTYCAASGLGLFIYRGLGRGGDFQDVIIEPPPGIAEEVDRYYRQQTAKRAALYQINEAPWPQAKPGSCGAFARDCEYLNDCETGEIPLAIPPPWTWSYSSASKFDLCNERSRRDRLEREDGTDESNFGSAVHRGLAEVYRQARLFQAEITCNYHVIN